MKKIKLERNNQMIITSFIKFSQVSLSAFANILMLFIATNISRLTHSALETFPETRSIHPQSCQLASQSLYLQEAARWRSYDQMMNSKHIRYLLFLQNISGDSGFSRLTRCSSGTRKDLK